LAKKISELPKPIEIILAKNIGDLLSHLAPVVALWIGDKVSVLLDNLPRQPVISARLREAF
jgi:hypothetical protein